MVHYRHMRNVQLRLNNIIAETDFSGIRLIMSQCTAYNESAFVHIR